MAVLAIAVVLIIVLTGGGGSGGGPTVSSSDMQGLPATGSQTWAGALQGASEANGLFKGIPQSGLVLGDPKAPVTMEMFIDVQCSVCDNYEISHLPAVVQQYIRNGKVQLHLKPWSIFGGQSLTGRLGVIAAAKQNKGFEYAKVLYDNQGAEESGWLTGREMAEIAASVDGLDLARWRADVNSAASEATAKAVDKLATQKKLTGTPSILVGPTNGQLQIASGSSYDPAGVIQALNAAIAGT